MVSSGQKKFLKKLFNNHQLFGRKALLWLKSWWLEVKRNIQRKAYSVDTEQLATGARAVFMRAPGTALKPAVLLVHGWGTPDPLREGGTLNKIQVFLAELGYHSLALALRGFGGAPGKVEEVSREMHLDDVMASFEWLGQQEGVDKERLCAFGTSYGAYLLSIAADSPSLSLALLAMRAPALYSDDGWELPSLAVMEDPTLMQWRGQVQRPGANRALCGVTSFPGKLLFVFSAEDEQMPPAVATSFREAVDGDPEAEFVTIPEAKHQLTREQMAEFLVLLKDWFQKNHPNPSV